MYSKVYNYSTSNWLLLWNLAITTAKRKKKKTCLIGLGLALNPSSSVSRETEKRNIRI